MSKLNLAHFRDLLLDEGTMRAGERWCIPFNSVRPNSSPGHNPAARLSEASQGMEKRKAKIFFNPAMPMTTETTCPSGATLRERPNGYKTSGRRILRRQDKCSIRIGR